MPEIRTSELIAGSGREFIANAYCAFYGNLPEPETYERYSGPRLETSAGRAEVLRELADSSNLPDGAARVVYLEDAYDHVDIHDPNTVLNAQNRFQIPVIRATVSRIEDVVRIASSDIQKSIESILYQLIEERDLTDNSTFDGLDIDLRLASAEKDIDFLKKAFESLHRYVTRESIRMLTEYFVNLVQVQLISVDERLASLEKRAVQGPT
ncbi:MAG TPA: hypothetical protein VHY79_14070 [Rhizomicrobium sp.]|nr:hypothetical protein [Rhizomicrobium sp.]